MKLGMQQCDGNRIGSEAGCPLRAYAFSHSERDGVMETPFASMLNNLNRVSNPCESELEIAQYNGRIDCGSFNRCSEAKSRVCGTGCAHDSQRCSRFNYNSNFVIYEYSTCFCTIGFFFTMPIVDYQVNIFSMGVKSKSWGGVVPWTCNWT